MKYTAMWETKFQNFSYLMLELLRWSSMDFLTIKFWIVIDLVWEYGSWLHFFTTYSSTTALIYRGAEAGGMGGIYPPPNISDFCKF